MENKRQYKLIFIIVCLIAIGILAVVTLACTGVVSVKHCLFSIDWKWDFWNCLESVGTIGATFVALFEIIRTKEAHSITGLVSGEKARDRALAYSCLRHARLSASLVDGDGEQCLADEVELGERNFRQ